MPIDVDEWKELLDRFATKSDLDQFRVNIERLLSGIDDKLDQVVVKEMQAMILKQEEEWKFAATEKMRSMQVEINSIKQNRLPPWFPNITHVIGWLITMFLAYRMHAGK